MGVECTTCVLLSMVLNSHYKSEYFGSLLTFGHLLLVLMVSSLTLVSVIVKIFANSWTMSYFQQCYWYIIYIPSSSPIYSIYIIQWSLSHSQLYNYHYDKLGNIFITPKRNFIWIISHFPFTNNSPNPWQQLIYFLSPLICLFQVFHINRIL